MDRPVSLIGKTAGGAYICEDWELRVTARCLDEDLNADPDSDFDAVAGLEIVKAFVKDRETHATASKEVSPLTCGHPVYRLAYGNDHRGATLHDDVDEVVWLLAYGRHRSGEPDDFFPACKALDAEGRLMPTEQDYERMFDERGERFAAAVVHEAPVILSEARAADGEHRCTVGGELGIGLSIEVDEELDATAITVAFLVDGFETVEQAMLLLAALSPGRWEMIGAMPSRELEPGEVAYTVTLISGEVV
ncbi:MAG TPA: hypothetical protein VNV44_11695 [Solirubrobacteraceae bacterium]|jgi:hypothetical protein|nr:hypothetical protein [Solirubrobacteraceae bacterium]